MFARLALRNLPDLVGLSLVLLVQAIGTFWILRGPAARASQTVRNAIAGVAGASALLVIFSSLLPFVRVMRHFSPWWYGWGRGLMMSWSLITMLSVMAFGVSRLLPACARSIARRGSIFCAPRKSPCSRPRPPQSVTASSSSGSVFASRMSPFPPCIRLNPFRSVRDLERAVAMANETRAHVALITAT